MQVEVEHPQPDILVVNECPPPGLARSRQLIYMKAYHFDEDVPFSSGRNWNALFERPRANLGPGPMFTPRLMSPLFWKYHPDDWEEARSAS